MQIFLTILVCVVLLGFLVMSHELGHLVVAKFFNMYCSEYSIGFGPKLFSRRKKGSETAFSLRAIPLGGYVSMYSEEVTLPDGTFVPKSRTLDGMTHPRRAYVMLAGIVVNFFLSIVFVFIYVMAFPSYYQASLFSLGFDSNGVATTGDTSLRSYCLWAEGTVGDYEFNTATDRLYVPALVGTSSSTNSQVFLLDSEASINGKSYVALYSRVADNKASSVYGNLSFYEADPSFYVTPALQKSLYTASPNFAAGSVSPFPGNQVVLHFTILHSEEGSKPTPDDFANKKTVEVSFAYPSGGTTPSEFSSFNTVAEKYWPSFSSRLSEGCAIFSNFFVGIGQGIASLFTFQLNNLGSIVMMGEQIGQISTQIGFAQTFFFYGGFLSLDLAIFNLLPFPGLDGWQLLVTFVEGVFHKKISEKAKNIVSYIGLGLLMLLSLYLIIRDVLSLVGI